MVDVYGRWVYWSRLFESSTVIVNDAVDVWFVDRIRVVKVRSSACCYTALSSDGHVFVMQQQTDDEYQ